MGDAEDELSFIPEQIEPLCYEVIESVLKDKLYNDSLVQVMNEYYNIIASL